MHIFILKKGEICSYVFRYLGFNIFSSVRFPIQIKKNNLNVEEDPFMDLGILEVKQ